MNDDNFTKASIFCIVVAISFFIGFFVREKMIPISNDYLIAEEICMESGLIIYDKYCINKEQSDIIIETLMKRKK